MIDNKRFKEMVKKWGLLPDFGGLELMSDAVEWAQDQDSQWWNRPSGHFKPNIADIVSSYMLVIAVCEVWAIPDALAILESDAPLKGYSQAKKGLWALALKGYLGISEVHLEPTNQKMLDHLKVCKSCQDDLNNSVLITSENQTASDVITQLHRKRRENGIPGVINAIAIENDLIISEEVPIPEREESFQGNTLENAAEAFAELVSLRGKPEFEELGFGDGIPTENDWKNMTQGERIEAVRFACNAMFKTLKHGEGFEFSGQMPSQEEWDELTTKAKFDFAMQELVGAIGQVTILQESPSDAIN